MKKKVIYATIAVMALTAGLYLSQSEKKSNLSDLLTENVEALAETKGLSNCRWRTGHSSSTGWIAICDEYGVGDNCKCGEIKYY